MVNNIKEFPEVFIVILNYNGFDDAKKCIESLKNITYPKYNITVVDNASTDNCVARLKELFPEVPILNSTSNKGYTGGMNLGIKNALDKGAELVMITNNDVVYEKDFLEPLVKQIYKSKEIGIVSPKALYMHDTNLIYCAGGRFNFFRCAAVNQFQGLNKEKYGNEVSEITSAEGSCMLIKAEVFGKAGFFNEDFFMYFEDLEFSDRVRKHYKLMYTPESQIYHKCGAGLKWQDYSPLYYFYFTRNRLFYFKRYNFLGRLYTVIYSIINNSAKAFILFVAWFRFPEKRKNIVNALRAIWNGFFKGIRLLFTS